MKEMYCSLLLLKKELLLVGVIRSALGRGSPGGVSSDWGGRH